jgi:putative addiction module killer protein
MTKVIALSTFTKWLDGLKDGATKAIIAARIDRLRIGLMGDVEPVGDGVSELRIHQGAGWRVYFTHHQGSLIILLVGGYKSTQKQDIKKAKKLARDL